MAWKGDSRRHSLARKGIKTIKPRLVAKGNKKPIILSEYDKIKRADDRIDYLRERGLNAGVSHLGRGIYDWYLAILIKEAESPYELNEIKIIEEGREFHPRKAWTEVKNALVRYLEKSNNLLKSAGRKFKSEPDPKVYNKWGDLVNMSYSELKKFMESQEGKEAGLSKEQARKQGIKYGRESAEMILKMKKTPVDEWSDDMWQWARRQISFISRMRGNKGKLFDEEGNKTRKHTSLLIWGHDPTRESS